MKKQKKNITKAAVLQVECTTYFILLESELKVHEKQGIREKGQVEIEPMDEDEQGWLIDLDGHDMKQESSEVVRKKEVMEMIGKVLGRKVQSKVCRGKTVTTGSMSLKKSATRRRF